MTEIRMTRWDWSRTDKLLKTGPQSLILVLLGVGVILFSLPALDLDFLISDDVLYYNLGLEGGLQANHFKRTLLGPVINYLMSQAMVVSLPMTRAMVVGLGMVPLAIIVYVVYRKLFKLAAVPAFFAALLPQILPSQVYIPAFVIGCYTVWGLLFLFLSLFFATKYLEMKTWHHFLLLCIFYLSAIETTELAVFLSVPMLVVILQRYGMTKSSLAVTGSLALLGLYKFLYAGLGTSSLATSRHPFDPGVALDRIRYAIGFSLPYPQLNQLDFFPLYLLLFIAMGFVLHLKKSANEAPDRSDAEQCFSGSGESKLVVLSYLFGFVWFISSVAPFTVSYWFTHRYFYPAAHGLSLLIVLAICSWSKRLRLRLVFVTGMVALTILTGFFRIQNLQKTYAARKAASETLNHFLRSFSFPDRAQIVVVGKGTELLYTSGYWQWSTGYLRYATKRADVSGQLGEEKGFYNPFKRGTRLRPNQMGGLTLDEPLFAFRYDGKLISQVSYCLQWGDETGPDRWAVFSMNPSLGNLTVFRSGRGKEQFGQAMKELESHGIAQSEVLWAGPGKEGRQSQSKLRAYDRS